MVKRISAIKAKEIMDTVKQIYIVDVRTTAEFEECRIKNAISLPLEEIGCNLKQLSDKRLPILVYCRSGLRSAAAARLLSELGYENILDFGGILAWPYEIEGLIF